MALSSRMAAPALLGIVLFGGLMAMCVSYSRAASVAFSPAADTTISEKSLSVPLGNDILLETGTTGPSDGIKMNRALLRFDLAGAMPSNAVLTSARLKMAVVTTPPIATNLNYGLHKVSRDWSESAATWTDRLSPAETWSVSGGTAPADFVSEVTQYVPILGTGNVAFVSNPAMVADVQSWVSQPGSNFGWILICQYEEVERSIRKFASRQNSNTNLRPALEIEFTLPSPTPLVLTPLPCTNGAFHFSFNGQSNQPYTVLYTSDLSSFNWTILTNFAPLTEPATLEVFDPINDDSRYYRVQSP